jgi:two-component system, cell cycle sensor histidine kinase and response regulator CckA
MPEAIRVLIAENDPNDADLMVRELRRAGFEPDWRRVEGEADYLEALTPDLDVILSDYTMPVFDGPRALELLRERGLDVPFILVSGTVGEEVAVEAMKGGASDYLLKDRLGRLGAAVTQAIARRREHHERRRMEAELDANVRRLVEQAPLCIAMFDREMRYLATSQGWIAAYGRGHPDLIGRCHYDVCPDLPEAWKEAHRRGAAGEVVKNDEDTWLQSDGTRSWLRWAVHPWRDSGGEIGGIIISAEDITEARQAVAALAESEARLRLAMDAAAMGHSELELATGKVIWSQNHFALLGLDPAETVPSLEVWRSLVHPDDLERVLEAMEVGRRGHTTVAVEYRIHRADNHRVTWLSVTGRFVYDAGGEALRFVGVVFDVTERRQAERLAAMQHAVTRVLAESVSVAAAAPGIIQAVCETLDADLGAFWEVDPQGRKLRCADLWSDPRLSVEGLEAHTRAMTFEPGIGLPGRVWASKAPLILPDLQRDPGFARLQGATKAGLQSGFGFPILLRGEVLGVLDFLGRHRFDPDSQLLAKLSAIGSQIGQFVEHRRAEQQLLQAQKMEAVGQLAGGIAHDFNNLLGVILGYGQVAARELGPEHKTTRRIEAVCKAAERAAALTRQILTFSRQQAVETRVCDVNQVVEEMEKMLRRVIGEDIRLAVELDQDLGRVRIGPGQLEQVIMNLAVNSRDAMPRGGRLVIETSSIELDEAYARTHPEVVLSVGDTGEGMEPVTLSRVFEPFFTTKEVGKGTGLGLAVVFGIVKQAGGSLSVYSEAGRGSTFKIYLPRVDDDLPTPPTVAPEGPRGGTECVLVVEDEDALRGIVVETLRDAGYAVLEAAEPRAAAALAASSPRAIDLLITDVVLPGQSGPDTAVELRKSRPRMRTLLMSGYTDRLLNGQRNVEITTPFLGKPFTIDGLLRKVREVLDRDDA